MHELYAALWFSATAVLIVCPFAFGHSHSSILRVLMRLLAQPSSLRVCVCVCVCEYVSEKGCMCASV